LQLPNSFPLNGSDYFQLVLDKHILQSSEVGNVGRMLIELDQPLDAAFLKEKLNQSPVYQWIISLNKRFTFLFQIPKWETRNIPENFAIQTWTEKTNLEEAKQIIFSRPIRLGKDPLFFIDLINRKNSSQLIFSFHHALMDARGVEGLVRFLGENITQKQLHKVLPDSAEKLPFIQQANEAKKVKEMLLYENRTSPAILAAQKLKKGDKVTYFQLEFTETETTQIEANAKAKKVRFGKSPLYLAATARSFHQLLQRLGKNSEAFWIPVPQDQRKKGVFGPIIGNQVSYLFYKLFPDDLENIETTIGCLSKQMMEQIRNRIPMAYQTMMQLFRHLPFPLYYKFMKSPTKGALSSFFFSDTGASLEGFDTFLGEKINTIQHFPPAAAHPGLTVVFGQYRGKIRATIGYNSSVVSEKNFSIFIQDLKQDLLGNEF